MLKFVTLVQYFYFMRCLVTSNIYISSHVMDYPYQDLHHNMAVSNLSQALNTDTMFFGLNQLLITVHIKNEEALSDSLSQINLFYQQHPPNSWDPVIFLKINLNHNSINSFVKSLTSNLIDSRLTDIDLRSQLYFLFEEINSTILKVFEIYTIKNELFIQSIKFEIEDSEITIEKYIKLSETRIQRRKNFHNILINGVTQDDTELDLIAIFEKDKNGRLKFGGGISATYFELMAFGLNFSIGAIIGTGWISKAENGTLLGMAEQLKSGEADVLIANSELLPYRLQGLRFLHPYYRGTIRAFFKQPPPNQIRNIFFQPLQPELWFCLGVLWLLLALCLKIVYFFKVNYFSRSQQQRYLPQKDDKAPSEGVENFANNDDIFAKEAFIWALGSACGQGWYIIPKSRTMKLIMLSGLTTFIFSYTAYSATIVTNLSLFLIPIKTWLDLLNSHYTIYGDTLLQSSLSITNNASSISEFNAFVPNSQTTIGVTNALSLFSQNKPVAIITVFDQFYQIASKSKNYSDDFLCKTVSFVNVNVSAVKGGMIVSQNSPFKKFFNHQTIVIQERGLDSRISIQYSSKLSPGCLKKTSFSLNTYSLEINDVFTAFAILLCGFLLSLFNVFLERVIISKDIYKRIIGPSLFNVIMKAVILSHHLIYYTPLHFVCINLSKFHQFLRSKLLLEIK